LVKKVNQSEKFGICVAVSGRAYEHRRDAQKKKAILRSERTEVCGCADGVAVAAVGGEEVLAAADDVVAVGRKVEEVV
jgi:hypothetical protein